MTAKTASFSLSADEVASFHERGYAGPFTLYQPEEMLADLA